MHEMLQTGHMHNRARMITASYLIFIIGANWRVGEAFFASHLIDYDKLQNNGGWQWSAGCGYESQQYTRIFNPSLQADKYDANGTYRDKWLAYRKKTRTPIDYATAKQLSIQAYKKAL
jgi:deoxyribodipyrimidine photo-lyase